MTSLHSLFTLKNREKTVSFYTALYIFSFPSTHYRQGKKKIVPLLALQRHSPSRPKTNKTHNHGLLPDEKPEGTSPAGSYLMVVWPPYPCVIIGQR